MNQTADVSSYETWSAANKFARVTNLGHVTVLSIAIFQSVNLVLDFASFILLYMSLKLNHRFRVSKRRKHQSENSLTIKYVNSPLQIRARTACVASVCVSYFTILH